jgi:ribonuclease P protein subunit RPR2
MQRKTNQAMIKQHRLSNNHTMKTPHKKSAKTQNIAKERIVILFGEAKKMFPKEPNYSHRYVQLARKIAMKYKVKLTAMQKRQMCKKCLHYLVAGKNLRVRTQEGHMAYTCLDCKNVRRVPYHLGLIPSSGKGKPISSNTVLVIL